MIIVWDEPKRHVNLAKHSLDFAAITAEFFATAVVRQAKSGRFMAIGHVQNAPVSVVFTVLGSEGVSIISMRPASRYERSML